MKNKGRRGYQDVYLGDFSIPQEFHLLAAANNLTALEGLFYRVSDNTVGAENGSSTALCLGVMMDAMKGLSSAQPENL
jgi:hypothetical protein